MYPELFRIPFTHLTVKTYGVMLVIGFLAAVYVIRHLSRDITPDPQMITNGSLYSLVAGVVGARLFYVLHRFDEFKVSPKAVFAIWDGGLELLGGVLAAIIVIVLYLRRHKLPIRRYLDISAIGLMLALAFGRIGCFSSGCCFGKPAELPWAVRFPYGSHAYHSQVFSNEARNRQEPQLELPSDFFETVERNGRAYSLLKPFDELTDQQKQQVTSGPYRCLPVHPTQLYSSANAAVLTILLYLFWRRSQNAQKSGSPRIFAGPGSTFALMFILYGVTRFFLEILRDDNPFEHGWWAIYKGGTISQNFAIYMLIAGLILMVVFQKLPAKSPQGK
jgi:phosphatidylglycerol:prolipoprotein diacylglycerol transferase